MTTVAGIRHQLLVALADNPQLRFGPGDLAASADPAVDVRFADLGMDSLARMELSIWLELEFDLELTGAELAELGSVNALAAFVAARR